MQKYTDTSIKDVFILDGGGDTCRLRTHKQTFTCENFFPEERKEKRNNVLYYTGKEEDAITGGFCGKEGYVQSYVGGADWKGSYYTCSHLRTYLKPELQVAKCDFFVAELRD